MKFDRKVFILLLTGGLILLSTACGKKEEKAVEKEVVRPIKMITVTSAKDAFKRRFPGRVRAAMRVDLAFRVNGPLTQLPIEEGQPVEIGRAHV